MPKCPKCGSTSVRSSYITDFASGVGTVTGKLMASFLPINGHVGRSVGYAAGQAGKKIGQAVWNKLVCKECGYTWDNPKDIWEN